MVRSCARRSFAAETTFMALVICRVFTTLRIRRRMSRMLGMVPSREHRVPSTESNLLLGPSYPILLRYCFPLTHELLFRLLDYVRQLRFQTVIKNLLLHDRTQQSRVGCVYVLIEL